MNRDLGNEFTVAIATIGVIVFALVFGILITLSSRTRTPDVTPTTVLDAATVTTETPEPSSTVTGISTTAVVAATETTTSTIEATPETTEAMATEAVTVVETATVTATASRTARPSRTVIVTTEAPEQTPEAQETAVDVTSSPTSRRVNATSTRSVLTTTTTPVPPSLTPTSTATLTPTLTPTSTMTPSFTPTWTPSMTPTRLTVTLTPYMTATSGIVPTPTPGCTRPAGWSVYVVEPGNTLFLIALAVGSTTKELGEANCLTDADRILTGDTLFVPRLPTRPVSTGSAPVGSLGCSDPTTAAISAPFARQRVNGVFALRGTATTTDFWYYKIEVRPDNTTGYNFYSRSETPVVNGELARIDTSIFGNGLHWVRVAVVKKDASVPSSAVCVVPVYFD